MSKVILVAGASSSFGLSLCQSLVAKKYTVYAGYRNNVLPKNLKRIIPLKLDLTSNSSCKKALKKILREQKKIDAVVNLVGISPSGPGVSFTDAEFHQILDTNVVGAHRLTSIVLPHLPEGGRVINTSSLSGLISFPNFSLYSASKFALRAYSLSLYHEWFPKKRYVICFSPGAIANEQTKIVSSRSARERIPFLKLLFPLTTQKKVVDTIIKALEVKNPPAEVQLGADVKLLSFINRFLPSSWWNRLQRSVWQKQQN